MSNEHRKLSIIPEPPHEVLPAREAYKILAKDILGSLKTLALRRVRRDRRVVETEYDLGHWKSLLEGKGWSRSASVREYVVPDDGSKLIAKIGDHLVRIDCADYYAYRLRVLQEVMTEFAGSERELIELGCGAGENLFSLYLAGRWDHLIGFDISGNAIQAAREAARHFRLDNLDFGQLDLTDGRAVGFRSLRGKTVFTYYCLEQLKYSTPTVIENIARSGVQRVIHIEPSFEFLRLRSLMDWATYLYIMKMDYQNNIYINLRKLEKDRIIRIVNVRRLYYAPAPRNDPTLICWVPGELCRI